MRIDRGVEGQTLGSISQESAWTTNSRRQRENEERREKSKTAGLWTAEQLRAKLRKYDRTPFIDLLALWMECVPSVEVIEYFAERYPDRFIKAMTELGRLAGFADKSQIDVTLTAQVGMLSDSQLEDKLRQAAERLGIEVPKALTVSYERLEDGSSDEAISSPQGEKTPR